VTVPPAPGAGRELRRLPVLVVVGGCIAVAAALGLGNGADAPPDADPAGEIAAAVPTVAGPDAVSTTWYCAEGTGAPEGRAGETILIANVGSASARADVTVMAAGQEPASRRVSVAPGEQVRVPVSSVLPATEQIDAAGLIVGAGVVVEVFGGRSVVEHAIAGNGDVAIGPCARQAGRDWYFASGTTERGAEEHAALFNPFPDDAIVELTFATDAGFVAPPDLKSIVVPRRSRVTVPVGNFVRRQAQVALRVRVTTGRIVAERSLTFTSENETRRGLTLSLGATTPASSWSLPGVVPAGDGAAHSVLVANFEPSATEVEVTPRFEDGTEADAQRLPVRGRSVAVVDLASFGGSGAPFAVDVRTTRPSAVVVEELAWWAAPAAATGSATARASPVPAPDWVFSTSRLTPESGAVVSVLNPGRTGASVDLLAYPAGGGEEPTRVRGRALRAGRQTRFDLAELGVGPDQVVVVRADAPVVAVRLVLGPDGASLALGVPDPDAP
jgi:Family of unknown function (DUF5719)